MCVGGIIQLPRCYTLMAVFRLRPRLVLVWGVFFILHLIQPFFSHLLAPLGPLSLLAISGLLLIIFVADILLSLIAISNIKGVFKGGTVDLTAEIKRFSINYYKKASRLSRRLAHTAMHHVGNAQKEAKRRVKTTFSSKSPKK